MAGVALGVAACYLARRDLAAMHGGSLDPSGRGQAERALGKESCPAPRRGGATGR
jgi:hypothetical protein